MDNLSQGIPHLFDLTHPNELSLFAIYLLGTLFTLIILLGLFGTVLALLGYSSSRGGMAPGTILGNWLEKYSQALKVLQHSILIFIIMGTGFFLCSTLANRYHHWEQSKVSKVVARVAGELIEQPSPAVRYFVKDFYTVNTISSGQLIKTKQERTSTFYLNLSSSKIKVVLDQFLEQKKQERAIYKVDFQADYEVINTLDSSQDFIFDALPPYGYTLLQAFTVKLNGIRSKPGNHGANSFDFRLNPGEKAKFSINYQAQGGPRWVYNAYNTPLSNFQLIIQAKFPNSEFASGIIPSEVKREGSSTFFTWDFKENVAVRNPFGVFTATQEIKNTGILPRLLILAPGILLWWLLLLYLSMPFNFRQLLIVSGVFFALIMVLTYLSRIIDANLAWSFLALFALFIAQKISIEPKYRWIAVICTLFGFILPVFALLISYTGLTLSLAGVLSATWLVFHNV